jgi:hypothetical protein
MRPSIMTIIVSIILGLGAASMLVSCRDREKRG